MESHHPGQSPPRRRTPRASYVVSTFFAGIPKAGPGMRHRQRIRERCRRPKDPPKVGLEVYGGRCRASRHCGKNFCFFFILCRHHRCGDARRHQWRRLTSSSSSPSTYFNDIVASHLSQKYYSSHHLSPKPQNDFDSRLGIHDIGNDCLMLVDGTDFRIPQKGAATKGNPFGSHKYAGKSALRYELGVDILMGNLV